MVGQRGRKVLFRAAHPKTLRCDCVRASLHHSVTNSVPFAMGYAVRAKKQSSSSMITPRNLHMAVASMRQPWVAIGSGVSVLGEVGQLFCFE